MRLTYNEAAGIITGELTNYMVCCDYTDVGIMVDQDEDGTLVLNPWDDSKGLANCVCHVNVYFTIRNVTKNRYHVVINRRNEIVHDADGSQHQRVATDYDGLVSFENTNVVTIDL